MLLRLMLMQICTNPLPRLAALATGPERLKLNAEQKSELNSNVKPTWERRYRYVLVKVQFTGAFEWLPARG